MKVDVSEIKTLKTCPRQWQLSSRNQFHLKPKVTPQQLTFGTIFHEALAQLYLGVSLEKVMDMVKREMFEGDEALLAMIPGYYKEVLGSDLDRFTVLDIEHHFDIVPENAPWGDADISICGSIDMIVLDSVTNKIYGFEHKTCKNFRNESYLWMDEQPRVYTWALQQYIDKYNESRPNEEPATLGGVYLNEVRKLLRNFQYKRTLCTYTDSDLEHFMDVFFRDCFTCHKRATSATYQEPKPSYMTCGMCSFNTICTTYMYADIDKDEVLEEFKEEFEERGEDHLEEKMERSAE